MLKKPRLYCIDDLVVLTNRSIKDVCQELGIDGKDINSWVYYSPEWQEVYDSINESIISLCDAKKILNKTPEPNIPEQPKDTLITNLPSGMTIKQALDRIYLISHNNNCNVMGRIGKIVTIYFKVGTSKEKLYIDLLGLFKI